jgi:hypothetical protein
VAEIRKAKSEVIGVIFNEVRIGRQGTVGPYYHYYQYEYASVIGEKKKAGDKEEFQVGGRPENKTTAPK